jgi:hypothetical protein
MDCVKICEKAGKIGQFRCEEKSRKYFEIIKQILKPDQEAIHQKILVILKEFQQQKKCQACVIFNFKYRALFPMMIVRIKQKYIGKNKTGGRNKI